MITSELAEVLRQHHVGTPSKPVPGFFVQEIEAPHHSRRADALWLPLMTGMRGQIWGYELKVSRADLMHELADPTKADPWMRYCNQWTLVVPDEGLLRGLDIPDLWGILVPSAKRTMRTVRKPASLVPDAQVAAHGKILARLHFGGEDGDTRMRNLQYQVESLQSHNQTLQERIREKDDALAATGAVPHMQERVAKVLAAVQRMSADYRSTEYFSADHIPPERIAAGIVEHERVLRSAEQVASMAAATAKELARVLKQSGERIESHFDLLTAKAEPLRAALEEARS